MAARRRHWTAVIGWRPSIGPRRCEEGAPATSQLRVVQGGAVLLEPVTADPWEFQADCVEAFVASWRARGFSPVTVENDIGLLERTLTALGRPAWDVTPEDIDRVVGDLALAGRAASTALDCSTWSTPWTPSSSPPRSAWTPRPP